MSESPSAPPASFGSRQRGLYNLNTVIALLAATAILILVNILAARNYQRFDFSGVGAFSLSPKTIRVLESLDADVDVILLFDPAAAEPPFDRSLVEVTAGMTSDLLEEYLASSSRIHKRVVEVHRELELAGQLVEKYKIRRSNVLIVLSQGRHRVIAIEELARPTPFVLGPLDRTIESFTGEEALTGAILHVMVDTRPKVYWTQGHGEKDPASSASRWADRIRLDGFELATLDLQQAGSVPADARVVIVAGARRAFLPEEIATLQKFLVGGGRLLLLLEPRVDAGLVPLARWFQIEARDDLICHRGRGLRRNDSGQVLLEAAADTRVLTGDLANDHPITEFLARRNIGVFLPDARSLKHSTDRSSKDQKHWALVKTTDACWGEVSWKSEEVQPDEKDASGPLVVAFAARRFLGPVGAGGVRPYAQAVVVGDSDFTDNRAIDYYGNLDLAQAMLNWLAGRDRLIDISPRATDRRRVDLTERERMNLGRLVLLVLPLAAFTAGIGIWLVRRR